MNMKGIVKDAIMLFVITLVAGALLGAVHGITLEPIAKAQQEAANATYREVFPDATNFVTTDALTAAVESSADTIAAQGFGSVSVDGAMEAQDASGNVIGYMITASSAEGYGGTVQISVGVTSDGVLTGVGFLTLSETPGLGMKAQEPEFKNQFPGKSIADVFEVTKTTASADNQVQAISGATITSSAVTGALNAAAYFVNNCIAE